MEKQRKRMWRRQYVEWAQTTEGGRLTEPQAQSKWLDYKADVKVKRDEDGPNADEPLQLSIPWQTIDLSYSGVETEKVMQFQQKLKKLFDEEDAEKLKKKMLTGHATRLSLKFI